MAQSAQITGKVEYREGDGPLMSIRPGPVEVSTTAQDATLSWQDEGGEVRSSTAMPIADFQRYVAEGAIRLDA
ncbi:MAG TPA: hypothetical protein VMS38_20730 [Pseudorhodoferax sp.]|jgi:hypothetical protein|nr:hypothetical protein [Pseudorhodoferax sp.]